jgi:hypothetical protein
MTNNINFDAEKTMGELNGLIDVVNEKWEQIVFNLQNGVSFENLPYKTALAYQNAAPKKSHPFAPRLGAKIIMFGVAAILINLVLIGNKAGSFYFDKNLLISFGMIGIVIIAYFFFRKYYAHPLYCDKISAELDYLINTEWLPRMKALRANVHVFSSNRRLREAYNEFQDRDKEISKYTIIGRIKEKERKRSERDIKIFKVVGLATLGFVGAAFAGGIHSAGKDIGYSPKSNA